MSDKETLDQVKNVVKLLKENERLEAELLKAEAKGVALLETVAGLMGERDGLKDAIREAGAMLAGHRNTIDGQAAKIAELEQKVVRLRNAIVLPTDTGSWKS